MDMNDTHTNLEIIQEFPGHEEAPDGEAFVTTPPNVPHKYIQNTYNYLHQVPEYNELSQFLGDWIAQQSMQAQNSIMGQSMAIGEMVESLCV